MTERLLTARPVVEKIKTDLTRRCEALKKAGVHPSMSVILVGDNPASLTYIRNKRKACEEVGAKFALHQLSNAISPEDFLQEVEKLNEDSSVHGIIIQLPVPDQLKALNIPNLITPDKDIDGFHGVNTQNLYSGSVNLKLLLPCTPKGIVNLLNHYQIEVAGKHIVVIGRSLIVGKPLSMLLSNLNATVTMAHSHTNNLSKLTKEADIVISAVGRAKFLDKSYFNPKSVVVDVGMNVSEGKLAGDVDFDEVHSYVQAITPVPGGVGPMTVVSLIENLITACEEQLKG
jgi:methylenetetrahydrofolate dehydrogenase (NADP+)/methenyltetrahydrofolate cyclohydrolase